MAHPQYQYQPRAYSPPRSTPSPHPGPYPPAKRQRLSPNSQSPYTSPSISNGALPNQVFSSPHFGAQPNGYQSHSYGNQTTHSPQVPQYQPPQAGGAMGPPSRPVDKPTDVNDLSDVLVGSGVDLREEEAALFNRYNATGSQQNGAPFIQESSASFGHASSAGPQASNFKPYNRTDTLATNIPGGKASLYGAGTLSQPAITLKSADEQYEEQRKRARQRKNERKQYHLNDPFLHGGVVRKRLDKQAHIDHVSLQREGLLTASGQEQPMELLVTGPDRNEFLTVVKGQDLLSSSSPLAEIFSIISLAAQERLHALVEDAATLAKGRRLGSHGVVPADLASLAVSNDQALLLTPGNSAVSPMTTNPLKRSFSDAHKLPTPVSDRATTPSISSLPNQTVQVLRTTTTVERSSDDERISKRSKRAANGIPAAEASSSSSFSIGTPASGTPGTLGERAPEPDAKKGNKKDQKKQADKATEVQQHAAMTQTMNMQLGMGRKKPSWMTSAKDNASPSGFPVPSRVNTNLSSQSKASNVSAATGAGGLSQNKRQIGDFREDKETGKGIQMRDVIMVLDLESKEKKALARAYSKVTGKR